MHQSRRNKKIEQRYIEPNNKVAYKVENTVGKKRYAENVANRMQSIVASEFEKIKKALNI